MDSSFLLKEGCEWGYMLFIVDAAPRNWVAILEQL
jgi:hypothetical protein